MTDEGYYLGGAKEKLCFGTFIDLVRGEACTFGFSPVTHLLAWGSLAIFGMKVWAFRLPFFLINALAYTALFGYLARRTLPWIAFLSCACVLFTPLMIVFERTASNDVLIASLFILAFVSACGHSTARAILAGVLCAIISGIKPSVYVLLPAICCSIFSTRTKPRRIWNALWFASAFICTMIAWKFALTWLLQPDTVSNHLSAAELIRRTTSHYALPDLTNFERIFCGLMAFPRYPANTLLSVWAIFLTVIPLTVTAWHLCNGTHCLAWGRRLILYMTPLVYTCAIAIMNTFYTHYFIPMILFAPILWLEMRRDLRYATSSDRSAYGLLFIASALALSAGLFFSVPSASRPLLELVQHYASKTFNLPEKNVWLFTWHNMIFCSLLAGGCGAMVLGLARRYPENKRAFFSLSWTLQSVALWLCLILAFSICYAQLPVAVLAPYMGATQEAITVNIRLCLVFSVFTTLAIWFSPKTLSRGKYWTAIFVAPCALALVLCPVWRQGICELTQRHHLHTDALQQLQAALPANAIVIGERAPQLLMTTPIRASSTFLFNSDPIPVVEALSRDQPNAPLVALLDREHCYNWQHYQKNSDKISCRPFLKLKLPSFATGKPIEVYAALIKLTVSHADKPIPRLDHATTDLRKSADR